MNNLNFFYLVKMISKFFGFIGDLFSGLGIVLGAIVSFVIYGLIGYFFLWVAKAFSMIFVTNEIITNEYIIGAIKYVFVDNLSITEIVFAGSFALAGALKVLRRNKE